MRENGILKMIISLLNKKMWQWEVSGWLQIDGSDLLNNGKTEKNVKQACGVGRMKRERLKEENEIKMEKYAFIQRN